jgi:large subunit ribosomal protein L23
MSPKIITNKKLFLEKPIITEKAMGESAFGRYTFKVSNNASKPEIKKEVENIFKVEVLKVNIMNYSGKKRVRGRTKGKTSSWKKAVITLKKGDKIDLFEGV